MGQTYRWNVADAAAGYDASAERVHPYYREIQEAILAQIARPLDARFLLVDLGGGSGRFAEKFLDRFSQATALVVDQSQPFLDLAAARLARFGGRGGCHLARLQDDWASAFEQQPAVIVSTSAIHHLRPEEKQRVYQQAYDALEPLGMLLNGDEIRSADDGEYLAALETWAAHMRAIVAAGEVHAAMVPMLEKWQERNVTHFEKPRESGDDCHETIAAQLSYFCNCGFRSVDVPWQKAMWAVLQAVK